MNANERRWGVGGLGRKALKGRKKRGDERDGDGDYNCDLAGGMLCATKGLQYRMIIIAKLAVGYVLDEIKNDIVRAISVGFTTGNSWRCVLLAGTVSIQCQPNYDRRHEAVGR